MKIFKPRYLHPALVIIITAIATLFFIFNLSLISRKHDVLNRALTVCRDLPLGANCSFVTKKGQPIVGTCQEIHTGRPPVCR